MHISLVIRNTVGRRCQPAHFPMFLFYLSFTCILSLLLTSNILTPLLYPVNSRHASALLLKQKSHDTLMGVPKRSNSIKSCLPVYRKTYIPCLPLSMHGWPQVKLLSLRNNLDFQTKISWPTCFELVPLAAESLFSYRLTPRAVPHKPHFSMRAISRQKNVSSQSMKMTTPKKSSKKWSSANISPTAITWIACLGRMWAVCSMHVIAVRRTRGFVHTCGTRRGIEQ